MLPLFPTPQLGSGAFRCGSRCCCWRPILRAGRPHFL